MIFKDTRRTYIKDRLYTQGCEVAPEHVEMLQRAGFELGDLAQPEAPTVEYEPAQQDLEALSYKKLKAAAIDAGYSGADGFNKETLLAYLRGE